MALLASSAIHLVYREGIAPVFALYRVVGASSGDSVALTTMFSKIVQGAAIGVGAVGPQGPLVVSGTTVAFTSVAGASTDVLWVGVTGSGVS